MSQELHEALSKLTVKEILNHFKGKLSFSRTQRCSKDALVTHILANAPSEDLELMRGMALERESGQERERQEREVSRKRRHADQQYARRVAARVEVEDIENTQPSSIDDFLHLPTASQTKDCYRAFYEATSNKGLKSSVCGVCARRVDHRLTKVADYPVSSLPNAHRLVPLHPHPAHTLFDGKLLEPQGVKGDGEDALVSTCGECFDDLKGSEEKPPQYALANNMWIGNIPWVLSVLTFPEQLLIAHLYPRVYVFKLFPKKIGGTRDAANLQRGMRGNVSTYELNMDGISSMVHGNMMPRPPAVLASVISVTFVGLGKLPKRWLKSTFRVRRRVVFEALRWLKENNAKYYGNVEIDSQRIENLPEDDVPVEVLGVVRQCDDSGIVDQESEGYVPMDDGELHRTAHLSKMSLMTI